MFLLSEMTSERRVLSILDLRIDKPLEEGEGQA
jgi:hypothetical protein